MRKYILLFIAALFLSCSKEVKVQPEDSRIALEAFDLAESIRASYVKQDYGSLSGYLTEEGYKEIGKDLKEFERVELSFTPRFVEIQGEFVYLTLLWKGKWAKRGALAEERGTTVFELEGKPLKLNRTLRESPFRKGAVSVP